jgi:hypothetical protein
MRKQDRGSAGTAQRVERYSCPTLHIAMESGSHSCRPIDVELLYVFCRSVDEASFKSALQAVERGLPVAVDVLPNPLWIVYAELIASGSPLRTAATACESAFSSVSG